jgi:glycyl-tRNA synthetase beta chain
MSECCDLLVEIGTEELPPKALRRLSDAFTQSLDTLVAGNHLAHDGSSGYA